MKKSLWLPIIIALELIALGSGAYMYAALDSGESDHIILATVILCLLAGIIAIMVTRSKARALPAVVLAFGVFSLSTGLYFLTILNYHERAYTALATGILCLLGGLIGIIVAQSRSHTTAR